MRFLGGKRQKINWGDSKGIGMSWFGESSGREADFSTALLTNCESSFGRNDGSLVLGKENRQRQVKQQPQVLRLRSSQSAVSHFAQDDKVFEFGKERNEGRRQVRRGWLSVCHFAHCEVRDGWSTRRWWLGEGRTSNGKCNSRSLRDDKKKGTAKTSASDSNCSLCCRVWLV